MADNHPHPDELDLAVHHEVHDVNVIAITRFGIGLTLIVLASMLGLWGLFHYFTQRVASELGEAAPIAGVGMQRDQSCRRSRACRRRRRIDLRDMRAAEDQLLTHYGWIDRDERGGAHSRSIAPWTSWRRRDCRPNAGSAAGGKPEQSDAIERGSDYAAAGRPAGPAIGGRRG